jgi:hypothetical protein
MAIRMDKMVFPSWKLDSGAGQIKTPVVP